jgi:hypothetical protein
LGWVPFRPPILWGRIWDSRRNELVIRDCQAVCRFVAGFFLAPAGGPSLPLGAAHLFLIDAASHRVLKVFRDLFELIERCLRLAGPVFDGMR